MKSINHGAPHCSIFSSHTIDFRIFVIINREGDAANSRDVFKVGLKYSAGDGNDLVRISNHILV